MTLFVPFLSDTAAVHRFVPVAGLKLPPLIENSTFFTAPVPVAMPCSSSDLLNATRLPPPITVKVTAGLCGTFAPCVVPGPFLPPAPPPPALGPAAAPSVFTHGIRKLPPDSKDISVFSVPSGVSWNSVPLPFAPPLAVTPYKFPSAPCIRFTGYAPLASPLKVNNVVSVPSAFTSNTVPLSLAPPLLVVP